VEALARGLPVVSTLHSGIPEAVLNGESGFLVHERDVDALAEKLDYLIEHPQLRPEMGRKGRKYVEEHYDLDKLNDRLVEIYRRLLEGKLPDA
jgi:colanic acid/amylovoran biosynthesis glycosyltransferase